MIWQIYLHQVTRIKKNTGDTASFIPGSHLTLKYKHMRKTSLLTIALSIAALSTQAQLGPEISSWIINTTNATGYNNIPSNVQTVQYSTSQVYVSCSCIPGYAIGPWSNPNVASNQNFVFRITRNPQKNTGTPTAIGLGHIGVLTNGVSIFNVSDAQSYNNAGIWNRNAYYFEASSFDNCLGHPQQQGEYHHHVSPKCLYDHTDNTKHSPIIGFAFDGFPVYGAYAYANTDGTGGIRRMVSSYTLSSASTRVNGPAVGTNYPAGCFIEDYIYTNGAGDLDARNGRFCVTPEYPGGTYAYFVTLDASLSPAFPYTFFGTYYGVVQSGNLGSGPNNPGGHNTISEATTVYNPVATGLNDGSLASIKFKLMPNPTQDYVFIYMDEFSRNNVKGELFDASGKVVRTIDYLQPSIAYTLDMKDLPAGIYSLMMKSGDQNISQKIIKK